LPAARDKNYRVACMRYLRECTRKRERTSTTLRLTPLAVVQRFNDLDLTSVYKPRANLKKETYGMTSRIKTDSLKDRKNSID